MPVSHKLNNPFALAGGVHRNRSVLGVEVDFATAPIKGDRSIGGVDLHHSSTIINGNRTIGCAHFERAANAGNIDRAVPGLEVQTRILGRMDNEVQLPICVIVGWTGCGNSSGAPAYRYASDHLLRAGAIVGYGNLASLHRIIR